MSVSRQDVTKMKERFHQKTDFFWNSGVKTVKPNTAITMLLGPISERLSFFTVSQRLVDVSL